MPEEASAHLKQVQRRADGTKKEEGKESLSSPGTHVWFLLPEPTPTRQGKAKIVAVGMLMMLLSSF